MRYFSLIPVVILLLSLDCERRGIIVRAPPPPPPPPPPKAPPPPPPATEGASPSPAAGDLLAGLAAMKGKLNSVAAPTAATGSDSASEGAPAAVRPTPAARPPATPPAAGGDLMSEMQAKLAKRRQAAEGSPSGTVPATDAAPSVPPRTTTSSPTRVTNPRPAARTTTARTPTTSSGARSPATPNPAVTTTTQEGDDADGVMTGIRNPVAAATVAGNNKKDGATTSKKTKKTKRGKKKDDEVALLQANQNQQDRKNAPNAVPANNAASTPAAVTSDNEGGMSTGSKLALGIGIPAVLIVIVVGAVFVIRMKSKPSSVEA